LRLQLQAYRSEKRVNAVMYGMAKDLTDEEIRILAAHYGK
jgi:cytochrome c553